MIDTPPHIKQKQLEIILSKTPQERFMIGAELIDFGRELVKSSIMQRNPGITGIDLDIAVFRRNYTAIYKPDQIEKITWLLRKYHRFMQS